MTVVELDDLTGLPLRRGFRETAERVLEARRTTERPVSMLVIDIDHFKLVNDTYGHLQGDDVLRMIARVMQLHTRPGDFVARYAGDEFVSLLPGTSLDDAMAIGERLRAEVANARCPRRDGGADSVHVSLSIGVAAAPAHGESLDALFAAADGALYASKRRGRNAGLRRERCGRDARAHAHARHLRGTRDRAPTPVEAARCEHRRYAGRGLRGWRAGVGKSTLLRQLAPEVVCVRAPCSWAAAPMPMCARRTGRGLK